jgi:hypothetical protein
MRPNVANAVPRCQLIAQIVKLQFLLAQSFAQSAGQKPHLAARNVGMI